MEYLSVQTCICLGREGLQNLKAPGSFEAIWAFSTSSQALPVSSYPLPVSAQALPAYSGCPCGCLSPSKLKTSQHSPCGRALDREIIPCAQSTHSDQRAANNDSQSIGRSAQTVDLSVHPTINLYVCFNEPLPTPSYFPSSFSNSVLFIKER